MARDRRVDPGGLSHAREGNDVPAVLSPNLWHFILPSGLFGCLLNCGGPQGVAFPVLIWGYIVLLLKDAVKMAHIVVAHNFYHLVDGKGRVGQIAAGVLESDVLHQTGEFLVELLLDQPGEVARRVVEMLCDGGEGHRRVMPLDVILNLEYQLKVGGFGWRLLRIFLMQP